MYILGSKQLYVHRVSQKDPGFDRGQFYKQAAVMRGQASFFSFLWKVKYQVLTVVFRLDSRK